MAAFTARNVNRVIFKTCRSLRSFHQSAYNGRSEPVINTESERRRVTMVPGDGVGPELMSSVQQVFSAAGVPVDFEEILSSEIRTELAVNTDKVIESCLRNKVCLKGVIASPTYYTAGFLQTLNMKMRQALDLYANVVHVKSLPGFKTRHDNVDIVIIRESLEGEYSALEHESVPGVVEALKIVTRENSTRIARFAFDYAVRLGRKKVTAVHKANIMKLSDGLFLECCTEMSKLYPNIEFESMIIDNTCMQLVSNPSQFDVMVMPNLYGNIVDNLGAGLVGGAGVVPGESHSDDVAVYESGARHAFPEKTGKDVANPTAILLCAANMLKHLRMDEFSDKIRNAVEMTIKSGKMIHSLFVPRCAHFPDMLQAEQMLCGLILVVLSFPNVRTRDMGGYGTRTEFTQAVIDNLHH